MTEDLPPIMDRFGGRLQVLLVDVSVPAGGGTLRAGRGPVRDHAGPPRRTHLDRRRRRARWIAGDPRSAAVARGTPARGGRVGLAGDPGPRRCAPRGAADSRGGTRGSRRNAGGDGFGPFGSGGGIDRGPGIARRQRARACRAGPPGQHARDHRADRPPALARMGHGGCLARARAHRPGLAARLDRSGRRRGTCHRRVSQLLLIGLSQQDTRCSVRAWALGPSATTRGI
jgi:hypothetical protein